jgi:hypothetical protein
MHRENARPEEPMTARRLVARSLASLTFVALATPSAAAPAAGPAAAPAAGPAAAPAKAAPSEAPVDDVPWEKRLSEAKQRIVDARVRVAKAEAAYSRARHDRHPRGEALDAIEQEWKDAQRDLREAEVALPELVEQARRAGVAPGVLGPYWD